MWNALSRFFFWLCWLAVFTFGTALYLAALFPELRTLAEERASVARQYVAVSPLQIAASALLLLSLCVLWCEYRVTRRRVKGLRLDTIEGAVVIDAGALDAFVTRVVSAQGNVRHVNVTSAADGRRVRLAVRLHVDDGVPVIPFIEGLQRTIRQRVQACFGSDLIRDIRVDIARVAPVRTGPVPLLGWHAGAHGAGDPPRSVPPPAAG